MLAKNASSYATSPILAKISKGPQYLATNLGQLPNFKELFFGLISSIHAPQP
jgi:hypothetical protein